MPGLEGRLELNGVVYQSPGRRRAACAVRDPSGVFFMFEGSSAPRCLGRGLESVPLPCVRLLAYVRAGGSADFGGDVPGGAGLGFVDYCVRANATRAFCPPLFEI